MADIFFAFLRNRFPFSHSLWSRSPIFSHFLRGRCPFFSPWLVYDYMYILLFSDEISFYFVLCGGWCSIFIFIVVNFLSLSWAATWQNQQSDHAPSEDTDQTWRMPRLVWVFAGRTVTLLVLSWGDSVFKGISSFLLFSEDYTSSFPFSFIFFWGSFPFFFNFLRGRFALFSNILWEKYFSL